MTCLCLWSKCDAVKHIWTLFKAYVNFYMYFYFCLYYKSVFLPVWRNKGVHSPLIFLSWAIESVVTFPDKLFCLLTEAHVCGQLAHGSHMKVKQLWVEPVISNHYRPAIMSAGVLGCYYFLPGPQLPSQPQSITALWSAPNYDRSDRGTCVWTTCPESLRESEMAGV